MLSLIIKTFLFQAFYIPSASMRETLIQGDRVLVTQARPGSARRRTAGDVVVFKDPGGWLPPPFEADSSAFARAA